MSRILSVLGGAQSGASTRSYTAHKGDKPALSQKSFFNELPEELIREILKLLSQSSLYQTALVDRRLNRLSVPLLYESFESFDQVRNSMRSLYQFLRVTKKVAHFSRITHRIAIRGSPRISREQANISIAKTPQSNWARRIYADHEEYGYTHLEHGPDMAVLLLLSSNQNIHSIYVGLPSNSVGQNPDPPLPIYLAPLRDWFSAEGPRPTVFDNLSSLDFKMLYITWSTIAPLFRLPSLKRLTITGATEDKKYAPTKEVKIQSQSSSIKILHFPFCRISVRTIIAAVSSCKALQSFEYVLKPNENFKLCYALYTRLYEHRLTLRTLALSGLKELNHPPQIDSSFIDFYFLSSLTIDYFTLVPENLPSSIKTLVLCAGGDNDSGLFDSISELVNALVDAKISTETRIMLKYQYQKRPGVYIDFRKIVNAFEICGYNLSIYARPASPHIC